MPLSLLLLLTRALGIEAFFAVGTTEGAAFVRVRAGACAVRAETLLTPCSCGFVRLFFLGEIGNTSSSPESEESSFPLLLAPPSMLAVGGRGWRRCAVEEKSRLVRASLILSRNFGTERSSRSSSHKKNRRRFPREFPWMMGTFRNFEKKMAVMNKPQSSLPLL